MPGAVHCNLSSIWTVFSMEGELQSLPHRAAPDSHGTWAALRGAHREIASAPFFKKCKWYGLQLSLYGWGRVPV